MKSRFILIAALIATGFTSCSVYKSGQTPDDVYYSPNRPVVAGSSGEDEYVDVRSRQGSRYQSSSRYNNYNDDYYYDDDAYLRMRVRNPYAYSRWSMFDNYWNDWGMYGGYGYGPGMSLGLGFGNYYSPWYNSFYSPWYGYGGWNHGWNSYYYWNSFYNPYCGGGMVVVNPKENPAMYTKVRNFNMSSYNGGTYNNRNTSLNSRNSRSSYRLPSGIGVYNNSNRTTTNSYRYNNNNSNRSGNAGRYYTPRGNSDRPQRTYTPPSSNTRTYERSSGGNYGGGRSSGSSGGSSGGGGGVSRPGRN